jgi:hypothetical protein
MAACSSLFLVGGLMLWLLVGPLPGRREDGSIVQPGKFGVFVSVLRRLAAGLLGVASFGMAIGAVYVFYTQDYDELYSWRRERRFLNFCGLLAIVSAGQVAFMVVHYTQGWLCSRREPSQHADRNQSN